MERKKLVVFGSYVTDLTAKCPRFPAAGETVKGSSFITGPGGKGSNQAVAAHRAGADITVITKVGDDSFGENVKRFYAENRMCLDGVMTDSAYPSGAALIMVHSESMQNEIVVIPGACEHITTADLDTMKPILDMADIVLTQLETNLDATIAVLSYSKARGSLTILNPAPAVPLDDDVLSLVDIITPNETEAALLTGIPVHNVDGARLAAKALQQRGVRKVIITLGEKGSYALDDEEEFICPSEHLGPVVDTTGAGDAFNGGLAAALSFGYSFREAIRYATIVSGLSVTRFGTAPAMPSYEEIQKNYGKEC